jgi:hypothetical protein
MGFTLVVMSAAVSFGRTSTFSSVANFTKSVFCEEDLWDLSAFLPALLYGHPARLPLCESLPLGLLAGEHGSLFSRLAA